MSDNGADGNSILDEAADRDWIRRHADNSVANTGRKGSFVEYGPGWAQVSATPLHLYKAFVHEGGIAVPNIVVMPRSSRAGQISGVPAHVTDVAPTILQLAGVSPPDGRYDGRPVFRMQGTSMLGFRSGQSSRVHGQFVEGWELNGRRAMRKGDWKMKKRIPLASSKVARSCAHRTSACATGLPRGSLKIRRSVRFTSDSGQY
ncbi:hypothetical protein CBA19CS11_06785 [Caballeronia novacaledonica]|nr:hypothetical protein CBA19CS11_06785 [Caballeronia novacaledonica]